MMESESIAMERSSSNSSNSSLETVREVPVYISWGLHTKKVMVSKTAGKGAIESRCTELFPELEEFFIQYKDHSINGWVDCDMDELDFMEPNMELKVVAINESTKRQATSSDDEGTTKGKSLLNAIKGRLKKSKKTATQSNTATTSTATRPLSPTVKFSIGWMNYNVKRHEFTQVRSAKGGGSPTICMSRSSSYEEVLREACNTFFPGGRSSNYGPIQNMNFHLADYRCNKINGADGWTLNMEYKSGTKLRLYLCTKIKDNYTDDDDDDDDDDELPDFGVGAGPSTEPTPAQAGHGREASQAGSSTEPTLAQTGHGREASQAGSSTEPTQAQAGQGQEASQAGSSTEPTQAQAGHGREASQYQAGPWTEPTQAQAGHGREASQAGSSTEPTQAQAGHGREASQYQAGPWTEPTQAQTGHGREASQAGSSTEPTPAQAGHGREASQAGSSTEPTQAQAGHGREASQAGSSSEPTRAQAGHGREASQYQAWPWTEPTQAQAGHRRETSQAWSSTEPTQAQAGQGRETPQAGSSTEPQSNFEEAVANDVSPAFVPAGTPTVHFKDNSNICTICCDRQKTHFFLNCGHSICLPCGLTLYEDPKKCPFCQGPILQLRQIY